MIKRPTFLSGFLLLAFTATSCFTPINSSFERAGSLKKKEVEFSGSLDGNYVSVQDRFGTTNLGLRGGYGIANWLDAKLQYRMQLNDEENVSIQHLSFYPKATLISERLAVAPEVGAYIFGGSGGSEVTFVFSPRLWYSIPLSETFEMTLSSKFVFFLDGNPEELWGFNVGWNIFGKNKLESFRPELGMMVLPGESPALLTIGVAYVRIFE